MIWHINLSKKQAFTDRDRDFLAELVSEEARKTRKPYNFILHEIIEGVFRSSVIIEGAKTALLNLLDVLKCNYDCSLSYRRE